jgi:hypothetical protein
MGDLAHNLVRTIARLHEGPTASGSSAWRCCIASLQRVAVVHVHLPEKSHTAALSLSLGSSIQDSPYCYGEWSLQLDGLGRAAAQLSLSFSTLKLASRRVQRKRAGRRLHLGARGQALRVHAVGCMNASPRPRGASGFLEHFLAPLGLPLPCPTNSSLVSSFCLTLPSLPLHLGLATRFGAQAKRGQDGARSKNSCLLPRACRCRREMQAAKMP